MDYASAISKLIAAHANGAGADTVSLNLMILANAAEKLDQGKLDVNAAGQLTWRGKALSGPATDFPLVLNAPGFGLWQLVDDGSTPFVVAFDSFPGVLRSPFTYGAIGGLIGDSNSQYLAAIRTLTVEKLRPSGLLPADEVDRVTSLIDCGIVCVPATSTMLGNLYRLMPDFAKVPVFDAGDTSRGLSAWASVISAFDESRKAYLNRQFDLAISFATAARNNADLWQKVYAAVEKVAAPAIALGLAPESDNYKTLFDLTNFNNLLLLGAAAAAVVFLGPVVISALAKRRAASAVAA